MIFAKDDLAVIVMCFTEKGWTGTRMAKGFPNKKWNYRNTIRVLAKHVFMRHTVFTARSELHMGKVLFLAPPVCVFCLCMKYLRNR